MHVLILGAGRIGSQLARILVSPSVQVTAVRRSTVVMPGVNGLAQDIHQLDLTSINPVTHVFVIVSADDSSVASYRHSYLDAIASVSRALAAHPIERIVVVSSSRVAHESSGGMVDEFSYIDVQKLADHAQVLYQAELTWRTYWGDRLTVVRPSGIYGPGRLKLIQRVRDALPVRSGCWTNRIHTDDVSGFLAFLALIPAGSPVATLYYLSDDEPILLDQLLAELAKMMQLPAPHSEPSMEEVSGKRINNARLKRSGYQLKYPTWRSGYHALLDGS